MRGDVPEIDVERSRHREEEVEVDERACDREEDLLHEVRRDRAGERATGDERDEHDQRYEGADVRRKEVVHCHADRVRRHDRRERDFAGIRSAEDPVVRRPGEERLTRLEDESGDDVAGRYRGDLVPEVRQPPAYVDADELQHQHEDGDPGEPGADLDEPARARASAWLDGTHDRARGLAHRTIPVRVLQSMWGPWRVAATPRTRRRSRVRLPGPSTPPQRP